jgi:FtsZ-binding cell division protein ZapB
MALPVCVSFKLLVFAQSCNLFTDTPVKEVLTSNVSATLNPTPTPPVISNDVAFVKLEQKLKRAMNQIADLSAEKESLDHLNIQLQEETDTVGEWKEGRKEDRKGALL